MGELAASRAVHLLLREAGAGAGGGIFPQIGTKLHIIDHEQAVCTSVLCVLWSSGQIKPPGEGGGGGFGGKGEGGLTQTETDVSKPSYIRCCSCLAPLQPLYNISKERKVIYTIYCFGVRFDKDTDHE